jgi:hypothetical protein
MVIVDTCNSYLTIQDVGKEIDLSRVSNNLSNVKEYENHFKQPCIIGKLNNITIHSSPLSLRVAGSYPKFLNGNNIESLTKNEFRAICEELSDVLGYNIGKFKISRLDLAQTIEMGNPVTDYFSSLQSMNYMRKSIVGSSLYFKNSSRVLCIYDKIFELTSKGSEVPSEYLEKNMMRIESRILKNVSKRLRVDDLRVCQLTDSLIDKKLNDYWTNSYKSIQQTPTLESASSITTAKQFIDHLAKLAAVRLGREGIHNLIEECKPNCKNPMAYKRMKDEGNRLLWEASKVDLSLMEELASKVALITA